MEYLNVALAKGRLAKEGYKLFKKLGYECSEMEEKSRKLIFTNEDKKIRFILVKASDVPVYVEKGASDLGMVGKDTIIEENRSFYEVCDLEFGECRFCVAALEGFKYEYNKKIKVATKYPNVAKNYYLSKGKQVDIIKLNGSVELAPLVGLSDVIVDIVQTGKTIKENGLEIIEDMFPISARLIVNKVSFKVKNEKIKEIIEGIETIKEDRDGDNKL
ncbi:MAG: ATP phosphoribosyltransferase [Firmicutes bacterium]|nr:ATP phosphoribosyltransferase [Bacillota bacterium]